MKVKICVDRTFKVENIDNKNIKEILLSKGYLIIKEHTEKIEDIPINMFTHIENKYHNPYGNLYHNILYNYVYEKYGYGYTKEELTYEIIEPNYPPVIPYCNKETPFISKIEFDNWMKEQCNKKERGI